MHIYPSEDSSSVALAPLPPAMQRRPESSRSPSALPVDAQPALIDRSSAYDAGPDVDDEIEESYSPVYVRSSTPPYARQPSQGQATSDHHSPISSLATSESPSASPSRTVPVTARYAIRQQDITRTSLISRVYQDRQSHTANKEDLRQEVLRWNQRC
jgi:hypothetical protein